MSSQLNPINFVLYPIRIKNNIGKKENWMRLKVDEMGKIGLDETVKGEVVKWSMSGVLTGNRCREES